MYPKAEIVENTMSTGIFRWHDGGDYGKASKAHKAAVKATPFGEYLRLNPCCITSEHLNCFLSRLSPNASTFRFRSDFKKPFDMCDFSVFMGLKWRRPYVNFYIELEKKDKKEIPIPFVSRCFGDVVDNKIFRKDIVCALQKLSEKNDEQSITDFSRVFILFVFCCILFPTFSYYVPKFLLPYVEAMHYINDWAWGQAVYMFLVNSISSKKDVYLNGCTLGLCVWVYEHVRSLGKTNSIREVPRFKKWIDQHDIQSCKDACEAFEKMEHSGIPKEMKHHVSYYLPQELLSSILLCIPAQEVYDVTNTKKKLYAFSTNGQ